MILVITTKEIKPMNKGFQKSAIKSCFLFCTNDFLNNKYIRKGRHSTNPHAYNVVICSSLSFAFLINTKKTRSDAIASVMNTTAFNTTPFMTLAFGYLVIQLYEANPHNTGLTVSIKIRPKVSFTLQGYHNIKLDSQ